MRRGQHVGAIGAAVVVATVLLAHASQTQRQTLAPHENGQGDAPAPIMWPTPELERRAFDLESAEERQLRVVVLAKHLEQPWSTAFLPDGTMLVTERAGRIEWCGAESWTIGRSRVCLSCKRVGRAACRV